MPVEFADKKGTRRIRFITGVHHDGVDYGPEYKQQEANVNPAAAASYVAQGRAVYVEANAKSNAAPQGGNPGSQGGK